MNRRRLCWLLLMGLPLIMGGCVLIQRVNHVPTITLPEGVTRATKHVELQGVRVAVDLYHATKLENKPLVILLHGFSRNRKVMASLSVRLAKEGFVAAALDAPFFSRHTDNGRAVHELAALAQSGELIDNWKPSRGVAYVGHSAGWYATLMAAAQSPAPALWVGLDPVDWNDAGKLAGSKITCHGVVLLAESGPWNRHGNAAGFISSFAGPMFAIKLRGATHLDPESPSSRGAEWVCGKRDAQKVMLFQDFASLALRAHLLDDHSAMAELQSRAALSDVEVLRADEARYKSLATPAG